VHPTHKARLYIGFSAPYPMCQDADERHVSLVHSRAACGLAAPLTRARRSQALMNGMWRKAYDHLAALTSWSLVSRKDETLAMLRGKLQARPARQHSAVFP